MNPRIGTVGKYVGRTDWLDGLKVKVVAVSNRTGGLTVEVLEDYRAYKAGDRLNIMPYEFEPT